MFQLARLAKIITPLLSKKLHFYHRWISGAACYKCSGCCFVPTTDMSAREICRLRHSVGERKTTCVAFAAVLFGLYYGVALTFFHRHLSYLCHIVVLRRGQRRIKGGRRSCGFDVMF
ncbi:hypothetical protein M433DRAFT_292939 [Acidomyces richmondensis BFW]|nr:MAG: hypothetical protein FE78DRAFT_444955 [Acidomyces sp. 'richmondensis']KYG44668.1 hypothetical protein M433DRAFT_292939 [Acidomyces richmondensis BFW]